MRYQNRSLYYQYESVPKHALWIQRNSLKILYSIKLLKNEFLEAILPTKNREKSNFSLKFACGRTIENHLASIYRMINTIFLKCSFQNIKKSEIYKKNRKYAAIV